MLRALCRAPEVMEIETMRGMVVAMGLALAGCSGAAGEPPVDLTPGLYAVKIVGEASVTLDDLSDRGNICFTPDNVVNFSAHPLQRLVPEWTGCREVEQRLTGNRLAGERKCLMNGDKRGPGSTMLSFTGHHTTTAFEISGTLVHGERERPGGPYTDAASGSFSITGQRIGDCS